jgi:hypothetical protein
MNTTINLPAAIRERSDKQLKRSGISLNALIGLALDQYLTTLERAEQLHQLALRQRAAPDITEPDHPREPI